jgi:ribosome biogenesis GTPase
LSLTDSFTEGQIVAAYGRQFNVEQADGSEIICVTRGKKTGASCGDWVSIKMTSPNQGVIEKTHPRTSLLYRSDAFKEKIIAANVTQIVCVVAAVPSFYEDLVNRCLIAAESAEIKVLILLNKADMLTETQVALKKLQLYRELGYPLLCLSAHQDIAPLLPHLANQTSVLVGQSGMGKSSIINALIPGINLATREYSETLDSGRHTTTFARLYHLGADTHIIDSPGLQEFGLHHLKPEQIDHAFIEFRPYLGNCKFNNCRHLHEPGCAVLAAVAQDIIHPRRLAAYQKLVK